MKPEEGFDLLPKKKELEYEDYELRTKHDYDLFNNGYNACLDDCRLSLIKGLEGIIKELNPDGGCSVKYLTLSIENERICEHNQTIDTIIKSIKEE